MPTLCCRMKKLSWVHGGVREVLQRGMLLRGMLQPRLHLRKRRKVQTTAPARQGRAGPLPPRRPPRLRQGAQATPTTRSRGDPVSSATLLVSFCRPQVSCLQHVMFSCTCLISLSWQHCLSLGPKYLCKSYTSPPMFSLTSLPLTHTLSCSSLHVCFCNT